MATWPRAHVTSPRAMLVGALAAIMVAPLIAPSISSANPSRRDDDRTADDGVCRGTNPDCYHTWDTAFRRDTALRILIFSRTGVVSTGDGVSFVSFPATPIQ